jgi:hypothetical protein
VETLRGDKDRFDALIAVLNVGFERGGVVTRLEKRGERFVEEPYEVYAPRVLAGIAGLKDTLEDRALPLFMLRKRRSEPVSRLNRATDAEAQALRAQSALACLTHIQAILAAYEGAPAVLEHEGIDDRAVDLWSPLVAVTLVADAEDGGSRARELLALARDLGTARDADAEAGTTARLLEALGRVREKVGDTPTPAALLEALRARPGWDGLKSPRRLAGLLNPLGIVRQQVREGDRCRWCYLLQADQAADLRARYGGAGEASDEPDATDLAAPSGPDPVTTGASGDNPHAIPTERS